MLSAELKEQTESNAQRVEELSLKLVEARKLLQNERIKNRIAHERFVHSFHHSPIAKAIVGPDGAWLEVNQKLCDLLGRTKKDLLQLKFQDVTRPADIEQDEELVTRMLDGELTSYKMAKAYVKQPNGEEIWIGLYVTLIKTPVGSPLYFVSQIISEDMAKEVLEFIDGRRTESIET